jgi:hypothetical protein
MKPRGVKKCCTMLSLDFTFCLMHMLGILKFEFVSCLNLNPKEKIKRKRETKFRIKGKLKEAHSPFLSVSRSSRPISPSRAPAPFPLCQAGPPCRCQSARPRSSLPLCSLYPVGSPYWRYPLARASPISLTRGPRSSASSPSPQPPRLRPRRVLCVGKPLPTPPRLALHTSLGHQGEDRGPPSPPPPLSRSLPLPCPQPARSTATIVHSRSTIVDGPLPSPHSR